MKKEIKILKRNKQEYQIESGEIRGIFRGKTFEEAMFRALKKHKKFVPGKLLRYRKIKPSKSQWCYINPTSLLDKLNLDYKVKFL